jgi:hypothetical protein
MGGTLYPSGKRFAEAAGRNSARTLAFALTNGIGSAARSRCMLARISLLTSAAQSPGRAGWWKTTGVSAH